MGAAEAQDDDLDQLVTLLAPGTPSEDIDKALFQLTWHQHGGSGSNLTLTEAENLPWSRFERWLRFVEDQREREQRALEKASKKK